MSNQLNWIERKFDFNFPVEIFPSVIERFRGAPARLEEITRDIDEDILIFKPDGKWSIKEHAGHLYDLEELGEKRLDDYLNGKEILAPADITNKKTSGAGYNQKNIHDITRLFRDAREHIVHRLENLTKGQVSLAAIHPRLKVKIRVIDWIYFMAEHDDHHLASIRLIKNRFRSEF